MLSECKPNWEYRFHRFSGNYKLSAVNVNSCKQLVAILKKESDSHLKELFCL